MNIPMQNTVADYYPARFTGPAERRHVEPTGALGAQSIYDPATYPRGVPNPFGPRVHAWNGGPWDQGTRFHGAIYDRPMATFPWHERPLWSGGQGIDAIGDAPAEPEPAPPKSWLNDPTARAVYGMLSTAGAVAGAYHGYKRNNSAGWAVGWFIFGSIMPVLALPIMFAQGFAEKKR